MNSEASQPASVEDQILSQPPPPCFVPESTAPVKDSRVAPKPVTCRHSREHHPQVLDRWLWRKLPLELLERVIAHLPLPQIIELCKCFKALSTSCTFLEVCSKNYPTLVGLSAWRLCPDSMRGSVYDFNSGEWLYIEFGGFPRSYFSDKPHDPKLLQEYGNSICACDGGLVCFVPESRYQSCPVLVCNPLTNVWKVLPCISNFMRKEIILVQFEREDDTEAYKVILVSKTKEEFSAHFYCSKTGVWNMMDSGLVYGTGGRREPGLGGQFFPCIFDCTTKVLHDLRNCDPLMTVNVFIYTMDKDHLFMICADIDHNMFISEFTWESSTSELRELKACPIDPSYLHSEMLFATCGFVLLIEDNCALWHEDRHQVVKLYDWSTGRREILPALGEGNIFPGVEIHRLIISELRWDISP